MHRLLFAFLWLTATAWGQSASQRFFQQHQSALQHQFGRVVSGPELRFLLSHILDRNHTDAEPNHYFTPKPAPLAALLAQHRGQTPCASLARSVIYPLLRFVLPQATSAPALRPDAPVGERIAATAHRYLGVRYGAPTYDPRTNEGTLDCSGLVNRVLADVALTYRRTDAAGAPARLKASSTVPVSAS